jgi:hypothetical protein
MLEVCGGAEPAVATEKETEVRPHETLTDVGTLNPAPVVEKRMGSPVKGAAALREAAHVKDAPAATEVGLQAKELKVCPVAAPPRPVIINTHRAIAWFGLIDCSVGD